MNFFKKKTNSKPCSCGNCNSQDSKNVEPLKTEGARIKVLGSGCAKCNQLEAATKEALLELGLDTNIEHVSDFSKIASYGVMTTPALVVDNKVLSFGKVLKKDEIIKLLQEYKA